MTVVETFLLALGAWFAVGAVVGALFLAFGVARVDASAKGAGFFFRPVIFLGCVILWPIVLLRWLSGVRINEPIEEETP